LDVVLHPAAKRELDEAIRYFDRSRTHYGFHFAEAVESWSQRIVTYPKMGRRAGRSVRRVVMTGWRYSILYTIEPDYIYVVAIAHQSRRQNYWRSRLR